MLETEFDEPTIGRETRGVVHRTRVAKPPPRGSETDKYETRKVYLGSKTAFRPPTFGRQKERVASYPRRSVFEPLRMNYLGRAVCLLDPGVLFGWTHLFLVSRLFLSLGNPFSAKGHRDKPYRHRDDQMTSIPC